MYCVKSITDDLFWIGGNDRRLALFEGVYSVPDGVSYNSYILKDDKIVVFDTVDNAVSEIFFEKYSLIIFLCFSMFVIGNDGFSGFKCAPASFVLHDIANHICIPLNSAV